MKACRNLLGLVWMAAGASYAVAQTHIDLRTQARSIDFSTLPTKPFQTGTNLPAQCSIGQTYFKTTESAGLNLFLCTAANVWTRVGLLSGGVDLTASNIYAAGAKQTFTPGGATAAVRIGPGALPGAPQTG